MPKLNISLAQMNISLGDVTRNYTTMQRLTTEAARRGSHLVVFPELWSTGMIWEKYRDLADPLNGGVFTQTTTLAQQNKISIVGSVYEQRGDQVANSSAFFAANGRTMGVYRKIHLQREPQEARYLQAGTSPLTMDLPWGPTSIAIGYDLRFPKLFRRYSQEGTSLIVIPALWPREQIPHWNILLQARAIENQVYVVAVNAAGETGTEIYGGHSMIIDPSGQIMIQGGEEPVLLSVDIELDRVNEIRTEMPFLSDQRNDIFG